MGSVAITNTFTNDTTAEAPQVNTNFSDLVNYINARNSGASKWDALGVSGDAVIDGTLSISGTDFATALATAISADGWTAAGETWTYVSATTFTISGDKTAKYSVGDKIKFVQTTQKYFYITGVSYSSPNTTITVCAGNVYSVANAAITVPYYSKMSTPNGFPGYFTFTPTNVIGYSGTPSISAFFTLQGRQIAIGYIFTGTSNSPYLSVDIPFTIISPLGSAIGSPGIESRDNGTFINTGYSYLYGTYIESWPSTGNSWTSSGTKGIAGFVTGVI